MKKVKLCNNSMNTKIFPGSKRIMALKFCLLSSWEKQVLTNWKKLKAKFPFGEFTGPWPLLPHNLNYCTNLCLDHVEMFY